MNITIKQISEFVIFLFFGYNVNFINQNEPGMSVMPLITKPHAPKNPVGKNRPRSGLAIPTWGSPFFSGGSLFQAAPTHLRDWGAYFRPPALDLRALTPFCSTSPKISCLPLVSSSLCFLLSLIFNLATME